MGDPTRHNFGTEHLKEQYEFQWKEKFNEAVLKLKNIIYTYQRLPKLIERGIIDAINTIRIGYLIEFCIENWNAIQSYVFNDVNFESRKYVKNDGFKLAIK